MLWRVAALLGAVLGGGCYGPVVPTGVACSSDGRCPGGQTCDPASQICDPAPVDGGPRDIGDSRSGGEVGPDAAGWTVSSLGLGTSTDEDPTMTGDRLLLVFVKRQGTQDYQLYQVTRASVASAWTTPAAI